MTQKANYYGRYPGCSTSEMFLNLVGNQKLIGRNLRLNFRTVGF